MSSGNLELTRSDGTATVGSEFPGSSDTTSNLFEFEGNLRRFHSHVNLEFLREFTRSAVSTDGSDLEPVDVTSDKVVESVARGLSSSDDSGVSLGDEFGTSELSVISSAIGCGSNILSEPKFETSVG